MDILYVFYNIELVARDCHLNKTNPNLTSTEEKGICLLSTFFCIPMSNYCHESNNFPTTSDYETQKSSAEIFQLSSS